MRPNMVSLKRRSSSIFKSCWLSVGQSWKQHLILSSHIQNLEPIHPSTCNASNARYALTNIRKMWTSQPFLCLRLRTHNLVRISLYSVICSLCRYILISTQTNLRKDRKGVPVGITAELHTVFAYTLVPVSFCTWPKSIAAENVLLQ